MKTIRSILAAMLLASCVALTHAASDTTEKASVGIPARIEQRLLPGTELEALPIEDRDSPIVLRVVDAYRHGDGYRYDLEYYGLEPGRYDLRDYLRRKDGSSAENLPRMPIEIVSLLPAGQALPHRLANQRTPWLGGYRVLLAIVGSGWCIGLAAILLVGRRRKRVGVGSEEPPVSLADRLKPLVERAVAGDLSLAGQAELERLLLDYWRCRLDLEDLEPSLALARLREHEEAGRLLRQVEIWLHSLQGAREVDIAAALAPYRELPDERDGDDSSRAGRDMAVGAGRAR